MVIGKYFFQIYFLEEYVYANRSVTLNYKYSFLIYWLWFKTNRGNIAYLNCLDG